MACTAKQLNLISNGNMEYEAADDINNMMWRVCVYDKKWGAQCVNKIPFWQMLAMLLLRCVRLCSMRMATSISNNNEFTHRRVFCIL